MAAFRVTKTLLLITFTSTSMSGLMLGMANSALAEQSQIIEEVVVTARKRNESLQDVPVAVSAMSGDQMKEAGISNVKDLGMHVPGLQIDPQSTAQIWIRGIGQRDDSARVDSPVGVYIDGVYIARKDAQLLDMIDTESVQVLRGPQGTLYGKNTTGGAILVTTQKPDENFGGNIEARIGNYNRKDLKATVNVPLIEDSLYSKITVGSVKRDGYLENVLDGTETNSEDRQSIALQLRWLASDSVSVDSFVYYGKTREVQSGINCRWMNQSSYQGQDALYANRMWPGDTQAVWAFEGNPDMVAPEGSVPVSQTYKDVCNEASALLGDDKVALNAPDMRYELDNLMVGITADWEINEELNFKSITGYGDQKLDGNFGQPDNDGTRMVFSSRPRMSPSERDQLSQEFQLSGSAFDQRFQYTAGVFALVQNIDDGTSYVYSSVAAFYIPKELGVIDDLLNFSPPTVEVDTYELKNTTYAAFFQGSYDLTDNFQLTAGIRWTKETRRQDLTQQLIDSDAFNSALQEVFPEFITDYGVLPLENYDLADDLVSMAQDAFDEGQWGTEYPLRAPVEKGIEESWIEISPMATVSYDFAQYIADGSVVDTAMSYFTFSEGFKSGTFEPLGDIEANGFSQVEPEIVKNFEIGFKLDGFEHRARFNVAVFHMQYDDMQLRQVVFDPSSSQPLVTLTNASESTISGVEMELTLQPIDNLMMFFSASHNEYEFKTFTDTQFSTYHLLSQQDLPVVDRTDENFAEVPETTFSFGIQYTWVTDMGSITPRLDYFYTSEVFMGLDAGAWGAKDQATFDAYDLFNARLSWMLPNDNIEVAAYINNVADEEYFYGAMATGDTIGSFVVSKAPPRMYGVELRYFF